MSELAEITNRINKFAAERDWDKFHSPKNLAMALSAEVGELLELFQWVSEENSMNLDSDDKREAAEEIADVFIYLVRLCEKLEIDLLAESNKKITKNALKYPVDKSRGVSTKYDKL